MKKLKPEVISAEIVEQVPEELAAGIGHIITRYSRLEDALRAITYFVMGIDPKRGRIAVRQPRAEEQVTMIEDLLILMSIKPWPEIAELKKRVAGCERDRDKLAHCVLVRHPRTGQIAIARTTGSHNLGPNELRRTRRMLPESEEFGRGELDAITAAIDETIGQAKALLTRAQAEIRALLEKQREQGPQENPPHGQNESKP